MINKFIFNDNPVFDENTSVYKIPKGIKNKKNLFNELYYNLHLLEYFGANWDALNEILVDTDWIDKNAVSIIHSDIPVEDIKDKKTDLEVLNRAIEIHEKGPNNEFQLPQRKINFQVYFPASYQEEINKLM